MTQPSTDEENWHKVYAHAFLPNISVLPEVREGSSVSFGRALTTRTQRLIELVPSLAKLISQAEDAAKSMSSRQPRSLLSGCHLSTTCHSTGNSPITGVRYHRPANSSLGCAEHNLCQAAYDALPEAAKHAYKRCDPIVFLPSQESEDDDGLLAIALPGTRRAIKLLLRHASEVHFKDNYDFYEHDESVENKLLSDDEALCEYLELCTRIDALPLAMETLPTPLECYFEEVTDSPVSLRLFKCLATLYPPGWLSPEVYHIKRFVRSAATELFINATCASAAENSDGRVWWTMDELAASTDFLTLDLGQLSALLDVLPPSAPQKGPLLVGSTALSELTNLFTKKQMDLTQAGIENLHSSLDLLPIGGRPEPPLTMRLYVTFDDLKVSMHLQHSYSSVGSDLELPLLDFKASMFSTADPALRKDLSMSTVEWDDMAPIEIEKSFIEASDDATGATGAATVQAAPSAPAADKLHFASRLSMKIEVRRAEDGRRRALLIAWARAHGLAEASSSSLRELLLFYEGLISSGSASTAAASTAGAASSSAAAAAAAACPPSPGGGSVFAFGSGSMRKPSKEAMRKALIEDSLLPYVAQPAQLRAFLAEEGAARLDAGLVRWLVGSRPQLPQPEEAAASGARGSGSADAQEHDADLAAAIAASLGESVVHTPAEEEVALLDALRPWAALPCRTPEQIAAVLPSLRLDLIPMDALRAHVQSADGVLRDAARPASPLRAALTDVLLPGISSLHGMALDDETPDELTCCITLALMTDPVVALDGKSYERSAIEAFWAKSGGTPISPVTREALKSNALVPNINLRTLCHEYGAKHKRVKLSAASPQDLIMSALLAPPAWPIQMGPAPPLNTIDPSAAEANSSATCRTLPVAVGMKRKLGLRSSTARDTDGSSSHSCAAM